MPPRPWKTQRAHNFPNGLGRAGKKWRRDFSQGEWPAAIAEGLETAESPVTFDDLKRTHARVEDPLCSDGRALGALPCGIRPSAMGKSEGHNGKCDQSHGRWLGDSGII